NFKYFGEQLGGVFIIIGRIGESIFQKLVGPMDKTRNVAGGVAEAIRHLSDWFWNAGQNLNKLEEFLGDIDLTPFTDGIKTLAGYLSGDFNHGLKDASDAGKQLGDWFKSDVQPALAAVMPSFSSLGNTLTNTVVPAIFKAHEIGFNFLEHVFKAFGPLVERVVPPLIRFAGIIAGGLSDAIKFVT